jgi:NAD(P)-dependent dehydrogenase (short-subunit alcohol dehydrogenase family)
VNDAAPITPKVDFARELAGLFDLRGKAAFVPGGTGGLGEAIAWGLALAGASVVVAGRERAKAERLAGAIENGAKAQVAGVPLEVTDLASIEDATAQAHERLGRIDILVNSVGMQIEQPLLEVTEEAYDKVYATNLKSAMFLAQAVAKRQVAAGAGRAADPPSVRPLAAWAQGQGLLRLLLDEGRARDAGASARHGARAPRHHGQRRRADLRQHRDDPARLCAPGVPGGDP